MTTKKRKHRVVIELTTSKPISDREAVCAVVLMLDQMDKETRFLPIWQKHPDIYIDNIDVKSFPRVLASTKSKGLLQ
jgi:hypothetical protein